MPTEFLPYIPLYDWDGDGDIDEDDAMVYLSRHLRVRVTDPQKDPLPEAKCRIVGNAENVYICDDKGVALIPIPEGAGTTVDLEWEPKGAEKMDPSNRFYWSNRYRIDVASRGDDDCSKRLTHLGFIGETLSQQIEAYRTYFRQATQDLLQNDVLKQMADWHDGGMYPGYKNTGTVGDTAGNTGSLVPEGEDSRELTITLADGYGEPYQGRPIDVTVGGISLSDKTKDRGNITLTLPVNADNAVITLWIGDPPNGAKQVWNLNFTTIPPVSSVTGARIRLYNLGYLAEEPDSSESMDEATSNAIRYFQYDHALEVTGFLNEVTQVKLAEYHEG